MKKKKTISKTVFKGSTQQSVFRNVEKQRDVNLIRQFQNRKTIQSNPEQIILWADQNNTSPHFIGRPKYKRYSSHFEHKHIAGYVVCSRLSSGEGLCSQLRAEPAWRGPLAAVSSVALGRWRGLELQRIVRAPGSVRDPGIFMFWIG